MRNNYITGMLVTLVIILLVGVGLSAYYVLYVVDYDGKNNDNGQIQIYEEGNTNENKNVFDLTKRKYQIEVNGKQFHVLLNPNGKISITMQEDNIFKESIKNSDDLIKKTVIADINDVVRVYETNIVIVKQENQNEQNSDTIEYETDVTLVAITVDGSVYKLDKQALYNESIYKFIKIESLKDIVSIEQIKKEESLNKNDVIAIDKEHNEILITEYLK